MPHGQKSGRIAPLELGTRCFHEGSRVLCEARTEVREYFRKHLSSGQMTTGEGLIAAADVDLKGGDAWKTSHGVLAMSRFDQEWKDWTRFASLAIKYVEGSLSEAEVERVFAMQENMLSRRKTRIRTETIEAGMILNGGDQSRAPVLSKDTSIR